MSAGSAPSDRRHAIRIPVGSQNLMLAALTRAAEAGRPCPSNSALSDILGFSSSSQGSWAIRQLEKLGLVQVARGSGRRIVTIVATGQQTAGRIKVRDYAREAAKRAKPKAPAVTGARRRPPYEPRPLTAYSCIDRTPCPRCGARGDIGCSHRPAAESWSVEL